MKVKLVIFDMDGTTLYTLDDLKNSLNYSLASYNLPERTREEVRSFIGDGIAKLVERGLYPTTSENLFENVYKTFLEHYQTHCKDNTKPYDGIVDMLKTLRKKGIMTAIVSNKKDSAVKTLTAEFFDGMFDYFIGEKSGINKKPAPDMVNDIVKRANATKNEVVYVGDSDTDILTAKNAGIPCLSVAWGYKDVDFLQNAGATHIINTPDEIVNYCLHKA